LTSENNLSLILRRLDEIERKLDHVLEELRNRLLGAPWLSSKEGLMAQTNKYLAQINKSPDEVRATKK
jgi:hypothetical protein